MATQDTDLTLLSSAARIATTYSSEFAWLDAKAFMVVNVTATSASPTITPGVEVYDATSGTWVTMWTAAVPKSPSGTASYLYIFTDTGFVPTGGAITESKQVYLAPRMRLIVTHADADSCTYSVGMNRVNSNNLGI